MISTSYRAFPLFPCHKATKNRLQLNCFLVLREVCWNLVFSPGSNILYQENIYSTTQSVRQHVFHKKEFHYLNVPRIGLFMAYDVFDCSFTCLSNQLCFSVNLAASKGADGKLWCELLPSDKYRNFTQFKENKSAHHFFIEVRNIFNADHFD